MQQRQVVGAHVEHHRQHPQRMDPPRGGGVDRQLADRDPDAADTLVADARMPSESVTTIRSMSSGGPWLELRSASSRLSMSSMEQKAPRGGTLNQLLNSWIACPMVGGV